MMEKLEKTRIKPLPRNATAEANRMLKWSEALDELGTKICALEEHLAHAAIDARKLGEIAEAVTAFNGRAARWPDKVTRAQIRAFARQLDEFVQ